MYSNEQHRDYIETETISLAWPPFFSQIDDVPIHICWFYVCVGAVDVILPEM